MSLTRRDLLLSVPALALGLAAFPAAAPDRIAAQDRTAEIVAAVRAFHARSATLQARFQQHFWSRAHRWTMTSRGRIAIARPGRVRFDYDPPNGRVVVSDGTTWIHYEPVEGTAGQYARGSTADATSHALGILTGTLDLDAFRASLRAPAAGDPPDSVALVLVPLRPDPHVHRLVLDVDDRPATRGAVTRVGIEDPEGNWNRFFFEGVAYGAPLDPATFRWAPPAGARELTAR